MQEMQVQSPGHEDPLEKEIAIHSSIPAWKILWMEEPCGPQFLGPQSQTRLSENSTGKQTIAYDVLKVSRVPDEVLNRRNAYNQYT